MTTLSSLKAQVRALRRKLILEVTLVRLRRSVEEIRLQWYVALTDRQPLPESQPVIKRLGAAGFWLPTFAAAHGYLDKCRRSNTELDGDQLLRILIPWSRRYSAPRFEQAAI